MPITKPDELERVLYTHEQIQTRVKELGQQITADYLKLLKDEIWDRPPLAVGMLRGALIFTADLIRMIEIPMVTDFMTVSSYGSQTEPGKIQVRKDLTESVAHRHLLVIEDIIDTGHQLAFVRQTLLSREPASLRTCVLLDKAPRREVTVPLDYVGFKMDQDHFVVGYGLDYAERYRNLPYVASLSPKAIKK
jgi:hypoxanthine phosphoribosyltransferase